MPDVLYKNDFSRNYHCRRTLLLYDVVLVYLRITLTGFHFSERIRPLATPTAFPLSADTTKAFEDLKEAVEHSVLHAIIDKVSFVAETDASDKAVTATLNQSGGPVAFFSRMLSESERKHSSVEKKA